MPRRRGRGVGCVYTCDNRQQKLPRGKYRGRYYVYVQQPDGIEKRLSKDRIIDREVALELGLKLTYAGPLTVTAARECVRLLQRTVGHLVSADRAITFGSTAIDYLVLNEPNWSENFRSVARSIIRQHLVGERTQEKDSVKEGTWKWPPSIGHRPIDELSRVELQAWLNGYVECNASPSLLRELKRLTKAVFALALERRQIVENPAKTLKAKSRKRPSSRALTLEECQRITGALRGKDRLIFRLLSQLGLLGQELFALRRNDIGMNSLRIDETTVERLRQIKPGAKNHVRETAIFLPSDLYRDLSEYAESFGQDDLLFPNEDGKVMSHHGYLRYRLQPVAKAVAVAGVTYQALRRTCATLFGHRAASVSDTQSQMRHSDPVTTLRFYERPIPESVKAAAQQLEVELLSGIQKDGPDKVQ